MSDLGAKSSKLDRMLKDPLPLIGKLLFINLNNHMKLQFI